MQALCMSAYSAADCNEYRRCRASQVLSNDTCSDRILAALEDMASAPGSDLLGELVSEDT